MQCHSCGADVRAGQKFCMECGASLRGVADVTGEVPVIRLPPNPLDRRRHDPPMTDADTDIETSADESTVPLVITPTATFDFTPSSNPAMLAGPPSAPDEPKPSADLAGPVTAPQPRVDPPPAEPPTGSTTAPLPIMPRREITGRLPRVDPPPLSFDDDVDRVVRERPGFRLRPLLALSVLAVAATAVGVLATMVTITPSAATDLFEIGDWKVNDFGTNLAVAGLLSASAMVLGSIAWCFGARWGAGLAGGAGAALAGWVALVVGLAEWPIADAAAEASFVTAEVTRDIGYWSLVGAGGMGLLVLLLSLLQMGRDGHAGLDPWVAALAAAAFVVAAGGPVIPQGSADLSWNYSSGDIGVDLPTLFFAGRAVQLGLLALVGVVGMLTVRRYGLGLAAGGAVATGWLVVTAATDQTDTPIGPGFANPGYDDLQPHSVTVVGMACIGFFLLVAIVMALLDSDR